jgi:UDP-N-acetylmuramoyl-tripeptide--D-alanyl-D-alanine ligase
MSFLLLEMGARGAGHIAELCAVARPDVSVVLNVGKAHLGEFGTQDDIARAKGELVEALPAEGTAVLNADDPRVLAMRERTDAHVLTFGRGEGSGADVVADEVHLDGHGRPTFRLHHGGATAAVRLNLVGEHHVPNAAAAAAAALAVGAPLAEVAQSLGRVETLSRWRMEVSRRQDGVTVVNDAYNANPDSTAAALRALVALGAPGGRHIAVLGEMKELGASTAAEHAEVGRLARSLGVDVVVAVGDVARDVLSSSRGEHEDDVQRGAGQGGEDEMATTQTGGSATLEVPAADNEAAVQWLQEHLAPGDVVLLKASRGARLDEVAAALLQGHGEVTA